MPKDLDEYFKIAKDPLVKHSNMVMEMRDEVVDIIVQFTEGKYANDYEKSSNVSGQREHVLSALAPGAVGNLKPVQLPHLVFLLR